MTRLVDNFSAEPLGGGGKSRCAWAVAFDPIGWVREGEANARALALRSYTHKPISHG